MARPEIVMTTTCGAAGDNVAFVTIYFGAYKAAITYWTLFDITRMLTRKHLVSKQGHH